MPRKKRRRKLPNGKGSITEIRSGNRYNRFQLRKPAILLPNGIYKRELVGYFETYDEAYEVAMTGNYSVTDKTTLYELFEQVKSTNKFKKVTLKTQEDHERNIKKWGDLIYRPIKDISYFELQEIMDEFEENGYEDHQTGEQKYYTKRTLQKIKSPLVMSYEQAIKNELLTVNLASKITIETQSVKSGTIHLPIEFVDYCFTKIKEIPDVRKLLLNIYTGLRPVEMRNLRKSHFNFETNTINGMGSKTDAGENKTVVLHPKIRKIAKELYLETDDYIMGKKMSSSYFQKYFFDKIMEQLEFKEERTPYTCRKTFAYLMNHYDVDKEVIKNMMGHASYSTSSDYYIPNDLVKAENELLKIL